MDKKRIIIAIIFIIICIGVGYLLYRVFFAKEKPAVVKPPAGQVTAPAGQLPTAGEGQVPTGGITAPTGLPTAVQVTPVGTAGLLGLNPVEKPLDAPVSGATVDSAGMKFYNQADGKFYRLGPDGKVQALSSEIFYNVQKVTWSPAKNESILEYPDGSNIYYNFDTAEKATLPKHWEEFSFSAQGDKIVAKSLGLAEENRWLITSDPQGKNIKMVEPMGENADKVIVDWSPNKQVIALSRTGEPLGADRQEVLLVGLNHENYKSMIVEGQGLETKWSPEGKKLLYNIYSARNNYKPELWVVNAEPDTVGTGRRMLNLDTWSGKCAFADERFAFCAVPEKLETGAGFAPALADTTPDTIYKIDLESGIKLEIPMNEQHTVNNMFLTGDGQNLYFTDKNQSGIFNIKL